MGLASAMNTEKISQVCKDCGHICDSLKTCLKYQEFNVIVENAKQVNKLRTHIKSTVPYFKGIKKWLDNDITPEYETYDFNTLKEEGIRDVPIHQYRFLTITFDPKKFSYNELTQPVKLINYLKNALFSLKNLFKVKPIIIVEYHKSGIPHFHINYTVNGPLEHSTLILRLQYYFSESLRNRKCIHDRVYNTHGLNYMEKSNKTFFTFKNGLEK